MNRFPQSRKLFASFVLIILMLPSLGLAECTCDAEDKDRNKTEARKYKIAAITSILAASAIGVCIPVLGKTSPALSPEKDIFFIIKAFAAGVILSTGFIHVLPDAFESLTSPCLSENPWEQFHSLGLWLCALSLEPLCLRPLQLCISRNLIRIKVKLSQQMKKMYQAIKGINIFIPTYRMKMQTF
ncbi:hypothetical protein L6164_001993 [Bauhinia variegata]|uniref:Uncharacterized protein n=1 Tax=Bauhinia variegata TaxID=167791 RepID=A0ACB9Q2A8_BAUVA|nr:hypothetical protein L6164_001993 [Bauhinia variegata]